MEQEERATHSAAVLPVERFDRLARHIEQSLVWRSGLDRRIRKIRQQAEMEILAVVRQKPHLQCLDQAGETLRAGQHRRNHHQCARRGRNASRKVHFRQQVRAHHHRRQPVHQGDCQVSCAADGQRESQRQRPIRCVHRIHRLK